MQVWEKRPALPVVSESSSFCLQSGNRGAKAGAFAYSKEGPFTGRRATLARFFVATFECRNHASPIVSDSLAEKDAVERDHFAVFAGDRWDRCFHLVCRHANSCVFSASDLAGSRCRSVCIFAGTGGQLAGP